MPREGPGGALRRGPRRWRRTCGVSWPIGRSRHGGRPGRSTWRWCRRNPTVATLLAAVALLLLLLTAGTLVKNAELRETLKQSDEARREATDALWVSLSNRPRAVRFSGRQRQRFDGLRAIRKALQLRVPEGHSLDELRTRRSLACRSPMSRCSASGKAGRAVSTPWVP